jgi:hypothetical protein
VAGLDRGQATLLPECLEDWVDESNPVRAVDGFVDALELRYLGFDGVDPAATGRPAYHPSAIGGPNRWESRSVPARRSHRSQRNYFRWRERLVGQSYYHFQMLQHQFWVVSFGADHCKRSDAFQGFDWIDHHYPSLFS